MLRVIPVSHAESIAGLKVKDSRIFDIDGIEYIHWDHLWDALKGQMTHERLHRVLHQVVDGCNNQVYLDREVKAIQSKLPKASVTHSSDLFIIFARSLDYKDIKTLEAHGDIVSIDSQDQSIKLVISPKATPWD